MSTYTPICQVVEIDLDTCTRTFGVGLCGATLNANTPRKCYNTFATCSFKQAYNRSSATHKFISGSFPVKDDKFYPCLVSVGGYEQEVNIAGFKPNIGGLGQRASVTLTFDDFPDNDTSMDKYQAERRSGAAQIDEGGYDPLARGSFWTKLKARNPNYTGRPLRVIDATYNSAGSVVYQRTRHYVISEIAGPDAGGRVTVKAKDVLSLADNDKAQAPVQNRGRLSADMDATQTSFTLSPAGIGNLEYPSSGWITVGSEIMSFTRTNNTMTVTRGRMGTAASTHSINDSAQVCFNVNNQRADIVIRNLLRDYAGIPTAFIPFSQWQAEFNRWGSSMTLNATICKPTGVVELLQEITQLGITLWWDEITQQIKLKLNHPNEDSEVTVNDRDNIMSVSSQDNDTERATRVAFWSVQIDPTKGMTEDNFLRGYYSVYVDGESPDFYGQPVTKTILCRWLNQGNDSAAKIITGRLLNRYKRAPVTYNVKLDMKDNIKLVDVVNLETYASTDDTGKIVPKLTQVFYRKDDFSSGTIDLKLQAFQFDGNYGLIAPNNYPVYGSASQAQKEHGTWFVGPSLVFSDGRPAYQWI